MDAASLLEAWPILDAEERVEGFELLDSVTAADFFLGLPTREQADLIAELGIDRSRAWVRLLAPDDAADLIQSFPEDKRSAVLRLLDPAAYREVLALLVYAEDAAGGLMNPRYMRLRPDITVEVAIRYLRRQAIRGIEVIDYAYVLDPGMTLLGVVSFRELFAAAPDRMVEDVMERDLVTVSEETDQEAVARVLRDEGHLAIPVVDAEGRMKGIVTADDIVDVLQEEATEDIQKIGGTEALDEPYLQISLWRMVRKRGVWLAVLFVGQMLTATAMGVFEDQIAQALVLTLFIPLIISSGGNAGSQAATLVIRAMALGEVRMRDWWRIVRREVAVGLTLGVMLGVIGLVRIIVWESVAGSYGEHFLLVGYVIAISVVGVVLTGTLAGSMLPLVLRRLGFDPASASAPFVATVVDVTGVVIYFSVAAVLLKGTLL
jgi:magnesium transporter